MALERFPYATAVAFNAALRDRLATAAKSSGHSIQELRRQFAYGRLLARTFVYDPEAWVLKGGGSLLARVPDQARHTLDIDLFFKGSLEIAISELKALAEVKNFGDFFLFLIEEKFPRRDADTQVVALSATARLGGTVFQRFDLDLAIASNMTQEPEMIASPVLFEIPGLPTADYRVYPLVDHIADKHAAMLVTYPAGRPNSRYRDLVDLVLIATTHSVDAGKLSKALFSEYAFRGLERPRSVELPDPSWIDGYSRAASKAPALAQQSATEGLSVANALLEPILNGRKTGTWNHELLRWDDAV